MMFKKGEYKVEQVQKRTGKDEGRAESVLQEDTVRLVGLSQ